MKSLRVFLCLLAVGALMTACQKESIDELSTLKVEETNSDLTQSSKPPIEYTSLEELNAVFIENGLTPFTLEDLDITQEAYETAQEMLNDPNIARSRCSGQTATFWLDVNDSGSVSIVDVLRARQRILGLPEAWLDGITQDEYNNFGFATAIWPTMADGATGAPLNPDPALTGRDLTIAVRIILGIYVCQ